MSSRALSLTSVLLLFGFGATDAALAQNLEAGKSPSQIFAQTCSACHRSPRGLLKSVPPGSLPGFLRQHYTTSSDMAGLLASYLVSNGAVDARYGHGQAKGDRDRRPHGSEAIRQEPGYQPGYQWGPPSPRPPEFGYGRPMRPAREVGRPEEEGAGPVARRANRKHMVRPSAEGAKEEAKPGDGSVVNEGRLDDRRARRLSKRGKPKADVGKDTPATTGPSDDKKGDATKVDAGRNEVNSEEKPLSGENPAAADKPSGESRAADKSSSEGLVTNRPSGESSTTSEPSGESPAADRPSSEGTAADKPAGENKSD